MLGELKINRELRIVKFGGDYIPREDRFEHLRNLVEECEDIYPGIDIWFKRKVKPGLQNKERSGFLIYHNELPIGAAVLRKDNDSKLCSMRIREDNQQGGIGTLLLSLVAAEIRNQAEKIHFTAPSQVWFKWESFFKGFGFQNNGPAGTQYRLFDEELACSANFGDVWKAVLEKLPGIIENLTLNGNSAHCDLVFSIKPTFAKKIVSGEKRVEIRRKFSNKWEGATALIYASSPLRQFVGEAVINRVITKSPREIWVEWENELGCSYEEFSSYCEGAIEVSAVIFSEVHRFKVPILHSHMEKLVQRDLKPPQSYCAVDKNSVWPTALSLSYLLRATHSL
jgi:predicted transcriptional regulator/N-acetylglutamate synthase-like GNAT family acetyltransferase